jgi:tetratricopeptide (TPR) repeat protein
VVESGTRARRTSAAVATLIVAVVAAAFAPVVRNGFVLWDDDLNLTENPHYRGLGAANLRWMFTTLHGGHYQPLSWLTLALDHALWGMDGRGYHLTSLALHLANTVLVARLLAALVPRARPLAVAAGTLLFAVHPLRVEAVAWATARRDVLAALFTLLAALAYLRAAAGVRAGAARRGWLAAAVLAFAASLLSKAQGMTLPLVLLVLDAYPLGRLRVRADLWRALVEKLPFVVLASAAGAVASIGAQQVMQRSLAQHGILARAAQAAYGLVFYLAKTLVPVGLSPVYPLGRGVEPAAPVYAASLAVVGAVTVAVIALRPRFPWALAAWASYVVVLLPVLGFAQAGPQLAADRYTYLATIPLAALVTAGLRRADGWAVRAAVAAVVVVLALATARQTTVWHDSDALWSHAIAVDPANFVAYTNRGKLRELRGDASGAGADYTAAIEANRGNFLAYYSRGRLRQTAGDVAGAIADYSAAIALRPGYLEPYNNRAAARLAQDDIAGAEADLATALRLAPPEWPGRPLVERNLAIVREALRANPPTSR